MLFSSRRLVAALGLVILVALGAARSGVGTAGAQEQVIKVGISAFEAHADVYYAQELGLFKRAGLNIDISQYQGGSAIVAAIAGGALQIGAGNPLPLAQARQRGIKVVLIAPGYLYDTYSVPPIDGLCVGVNSPIRSAKDLNGKTIAVTGVRGLDQIAAFLWIDTHGGDSTTVKVVEFPQSVMAEAVADGRVDAAMIGDPALSAGIDTGKVRLFAKAYDAIAKRFTPASWFSSEDWANKNPTIVRKFEAAINEGSRWAVKNPEAAATVLQKYMKVTFTKAHEYHARTLDPAFVQPLLDAAAKYKIIEPMKAAEIIWRG
jgi:NitT/TauT family transport system substrate-binding protein